MPDIYVFILRFIFMVRERELLPPLQTVPLQNYFHSEISHILSHCKYKKMHTASNKDRNGFSDDGKPTLQHVVLRPPTPPATENSEPARFGLPNNAQSSQIVKLSLLLTL